MPICPISPPKDYEKMPPKFIQLVELNTDDYEEVRNLFFQWSGLLIANAEVSPIVTQDTDDEGWVVAVVVYDSRADAIRVSDMDLTKYVYKKLEELSNDGLFFRNLEISE